MTSFDYVPNYFWKLAQAHDPSKLVQLEIHPGLNCGLYRCAYCFGHGQASMRGKVLGVADYDDIASSLESQKPTVIMSGVATEPLTHPNPAGVIASFASRGIPLGLYTKGHAMTAEVRESLVEGPGERFVTVSVDAGTEEEYARLHNIALAKNEQDQVSLAAVLENIDALWKLKTKRKPELKLRASILVFDELTRPGALATAIALLEDKVDLIRIAIAQDRNDGGRVENLPKDRQSILHRLQSEWLEHPKVAVLANTHTPTRAKHFKRCMVQRSQVTIDKSGNVFPCPQVALAPYQHLCLGNVRETPLPQILTSARRLDQFEWDVDRQMKCRICDRKDEAINSSIVGHESAFDGDAEDTDSNCPSC